MNKEFFKEKMKNGFNIQLLAEAFNCSISNINKLKSKPIEGEIYTKKYVNTDALYNFAKINNIDLDNIDLDNIINNAKKHKRKEINFKVGDMTKFGKIESILTVGKRLIYQCVNPITFKITYHNKKELKGGEKNAK